MVLTWIIRSRMYVNRVTEYTDQLMYKSRGAAQQSGKWPPNINTFINLYSAPQPHSNSPTNITASTPFFGHTPNTFVNENKLVPPIYF